MLSRLAAPTASGLKREMGHNRSKDNHATIKVALAGVSLKKNQPDGASGASASEPISAVSVGGDVREPSEQDKADGHAQLQRRQDEQFRHDGTGRENSKETMALMKVGNACGGQQVNAGAFDPKPSAWPCDG